MNTYILKLSAVGSLLTREAFEPENSPKQLQRAVGGYIECAPTKMPAQLLDIDCFVDEEGLLKGVPIVNKPVTRLCGHPAITIVGDAVFVTHDDEGNTLGLTKRKCDALEEHLVSIGAIKAEDFGKVKE